MEKSVALKRRVVGAMIYPVMVIGIAVIILIAIMKWIVPKFIEIFAKFKIPELPLPTRILVGVSHFVGSYWYLLVLVPILFWVILRMTKASRTGQYMLDWLKMHVPIVGSIVNRTAIARFARTLGTLITSGVPILDALNITRETVGNAVVARALGQVHDSIREGESIAGPLRQSGVVDPIVVNMVDVGEETGELDKMLVKVADNYDAEVDHLVGTLMSAMEPLLVVFLGATIGSIVISLFLPLVKLIEQVGRQG
jgi:type IV pilus assembly protein PilC